MMDITKLKPIDDTAVACRDALDRIRVACAEAQTLITNASARRDNLMTEGSVKEIRKAEQDLADARLDLDRLKLLDERVQEQLEKADARERQAALDAEHAALVEDIENHVTALGKELTPIARKLREIKKRHAALEARVTAYAGDKPLPAVAGGWFIPNEPTTAADREAAEQAAREAEETARLRLQKIRLEQARATQVRFEEQAARDREREARPKLDRVGRVEFAPTDHPIVRVGVSSRP